VRTREKTGTKENAGVPGKGGKGPTTSDVLLASNREIAGRSIETETTRKSLGVINGACTAITPLQSGGAGRTPVLFKGHITSDLPNRTQVVWGAKSRTCSKRGKTNQREKLGMRAHATNGIGKKKISSITAKKKTTRDYKCKGGPDKRLKQKGVVVTSRNPRHKKDQKEDPRVGDRGGDPHG